MSDPAPLTPADRAARIRNVALLAGYDSALGANAVLEIIVDVICYARAAGLPFEEALDRARKATGQTIAEPKTSAMTSAGVTLTEPWTHCSHCSRVHPAWAACLRGVDPLGQAIRLELDAGTGRIAAHVERWYARQPGTLLDAEHRMAQA